MNRFFLKNLLFNINNLSQKTISTSAQFQRLLKNNSKDITSEVFSNSPRFSNIKFEFERPKSVKPFSLQKTINQSNRFKNVRCNQRIVKLYNNFEEIIKKIQEQSDYAARDHCFDLFMYIFIVSTSYLMFFYL